MFFISLLSFFANICIHSLFNFQGTLLQLIIVAFRYLVGTSGLEPPTSRLSGVRSNHLSYAPMFNQSAFSFPKLPDLMVEMRRIELLTPCLQGRCSPS